MPLPPSWILFNIVGYCLIWTVCDVRARRQQGYSIKREIAGAVPLPRSWILFNIVGYCLIWTVCDVRARRQQGYSIKREIAGAVPLLRSWIRLLYKYQRLQVPCPYPQVGSGDSINTRDYGCAALTPKLDIV